MELTEGLIAEVGDEDVKKRMSEGVKDYSAIILKKIRKKMIGISARICGTFICCTEELSR